MFLQFLNITLTHFVFLYLKVQNSSQFPPPLKREEETELFLKSRQGDENARAKLIEHNLRLVAHIIKKYYTDENYQEDLISIGTIGLIKAIDSFNPENGIRFATYGGKCVQNEILMFFRSQKKSSLETSINETLEVDKDGNGLTILDVLRVEDDIVEQIEKKDKTRLALRAVEKTLSRREKEIVILRYGLNGKKPITQKEVAARLGISRSYVSRIEKAAMQKLYLDLTKPQSFI